MSKRAVEHHTQAAEHHEHAAQHHKEAAKHHGLGQHEKAAHHARLAEESRRLAAHHAEQAGKAHIEHYGDTLLEPTTLASVTKEMALPRVAHSARKEATVVSIDDAKKVAP